MNSKLFAHLEQLVQSSPVGAKGVLYHPYLSSVGVIAPFVEPGARAQFFGLSSEHTRADMLRAIYEGVAYAIRDCYRAMGVSIQEIRLCGGGAKSHLWTQIIADCTGVRVVVPSGREFGSRGAAMLAGLGIGQFTSLDETANLLEIARIQEPDAATSRIHDDIFGKYQMIRRLLVPAWH
jgi:sugar (pentulose or hexulose) kinase